MLHVLFLKVVLFYPTNDAVNSIFMDGVFFIHVFHFFSFI